MNVRYSDSLEGLASLHRVCRRIGARMDSVSSGFFVTSTGRTADDLRLVLRRATRDGLVALMIDDASEYGQGLLFTGY